MQLRSKRGKLGFVVISGTQAQRCDLGQNVQQFLRLRGELALSTP